MKTLLQSRFLRRAIPHHITTILYIGTGQAGSVPRKTGAVWSSSGYRDFFAAKGQFFTIEGGCSEQGCACAGSAKDTISPSEIRIGDLLLTETDGDYSNGPDHTCIAWKIENGVLYTIDGNAKLGNAYGSVKIRERDLAKKAGTFHGVCRPQYKTIPAPAPEENYELSDIVDHTDPIDGDFRVKRKKNLELKIVYKKDASDLVENVDYKVTAGKKRIKNAVFEKKSTDDAGNTCTRLSFKGKKKGKVEIVFSITLVNGQKLTQSFSGKVK